MLRVDRQQLEPEPEPVKRHPVANWRPHSGPTEERHPRCLLTMPEPEISICLHMAGQHTEHIEFGANQYACWFRCSLCEKTSPRIFYRYTICMKCPGRRRDDFEPLWHISTRCVLMKWNCLLLRLLWTGTEDIRAYFAQQIREFSQHRQLVEVDDSETMETFHDPIESDHSMTQTLRDLRWAPPTRHAVLNEETADIGLIPEASGSTLDQPRLSHMSDNLRAEVSLLKTEQEPTSLADRFSRSGLPFTMGHLHGGLAMEEDFPSAETQEDEDKLDKTRSNEAHPRHVVQQQDPCSTQGPRPSKPFEGLEQCLSWHQQAWNHLFHACPCQRRRCVGLQFEELSQPRAVDGYASHRGYPILKPPHTTKQALTRARDRVQVWKGRRANPDDGQPGPSREWLTHMRDIAFPTSPSRMMSRVPIVRNPGEEYDTRQGHSSGVPSTYLASRPLLDRDGQDSEGFPLQGDDSRQDLEDIPCNIATGSQSRTVTHGTDVIPLMHGTSDHGDSRRLASGLPANLSDENPGIIPGFSPRTDHSGSGRQTDPDDRRTSDWRSSTPGRDILSPSTGRPMCVSPTLIRSSSGSQQQVQRTENLEGFRGPSIEHGTGYHRECQQDLDDRVAAPWPTWRNHIQSEVARTTANS